MISCKPQSDEFKYIDIDSIDNKNHRIISPKILKVKNAPSRASRYTQPGDVLFSMVRPYLKNIALVEEGSCIASTGFFVCSPMQLLTSEYCYYMMLSDYVVYGLNQYMKGDNSPSINNSHITSWLYPIPPINEQLRITAEIKKWFVFIDDLESGEIELESLIKQVKSKILDLAISGKLVPHDPDDEPAIELLKRINPAFEPCDNSHYENLPQGWVNLTLGDVCNFERGVTFPSSAKSTIKQSATIACIRTANVQEELDLTDLWYIGAEYIKGNPNKLVRKNDIIMSSANSRELVGKVSYVYDLSEDMTFGGFVLNIRAKECILPFYLFLILRALYLNGTYLTIATQTTNIANLNTKILSGIEVMIPSLAEQERIMKAVTQIFANIDAITAELS